MTFHENVAKMPFHTHSKVIARKDEDAMSSKFRTVMLHTVVGTPADFRPRAPFVPEICLHEGPGPSVFADRLLPVGQWGGWPAVLQETLQESEKSRTHLVGGIPFDSLASIPEGRCSEFFTSIKRLLITARRNLTAKGVEEIRTGALITRRECLDWYAPDTESETLTHLDRLKGLGFSRFLLAVVPQDASPVLAPFLRVPGPEPGTAKAKEWASLMVEAGHFSASG